MAEALVGGAFLSAFINVVLERVSSAEFVKLIQGKKLDQDLLQRLNNALCAAEVLLIDAEQKQINNPSVKNWLHNLRDAVYVADDLLDRVFTQAATQKKVSNFLPRFLHFHDREIVNKMEEVVRRIEDIEKRKYILDLKHIPKENFSWRIPSTSLVKGNIYGREIDQDAIIHILKDDTEDQISVIPIVGMGGVGKTTLAQWVYNNESLMKEFNLKAWVCVSEEFDIVKATKTIIESLTSGVCNKMDLDLLQLDLKERIAGKKFFFVLDDVWSDDYDDWSSLKTPFQYGIKGSKILVTTRSEKVASVVQTCSPYHVNHLSDEQCWSVFADHACFPKTNGNLILENIGREIVKKCKGLPLAAQTLGGLLRAKHNAKDWNAILTNELWEFSANDSKIIPALRISYYHLPPSLKRCFAYCSLYPKDYRFQKDELILLWMAEDLLEQPNKGKTLEEVGAEYFDELAFRLFFKQDQPDDSMSFVMHDLMHDLAISVAGDFYFRSDELGTVNKIKIHTRHLSYGRLSHPISKNFDAIDELKSLRTFLQVHFSHPSFSFASAIFIVLSKFNYLRVLSFKYCMELDILPDSIAELIHLRYLDLSETGIKTLPESLTKLYNLQTLKLYYCSRLTMLPSGLQNLANLRRLDTRGTALKEMPGGMSKLKHLQFLSDFVVGKHEDNGIKELGDLSHLRESLHISKLENVTDSGEAAEARIMDKAFIKELLLQCSSEADLNTTSSHAEREIYDKLQPHNSLEILYILNYRGTRFPDWVGHSSYHSITAINLSSCRNCCMLPSLGHLSSLKFLHISNFDVLETVGAGFYKNDNGHSSLETPFLSLEYLSFWSMPCWEEWYSFKYQAFPKLKNLRIGDCPKLRGQLPENLPALEILEISRCADLVSSLPRAPTIRLLRISKSNKIKFEELPMSVHQLSIDGCDLVGSMFGVFSITQPNCLHDLSISDCSLAVSFVGDCLPECLKTLRISNCGKLEFPKQQHELLESLKITNSFDSLSSFPLEVFPNINHVEIQKCKNLEALSTPQSQVSNLHTLIIGECPNLAWFPREGFAAPNLTRLDVRNCHKLKWLPGHMNTLLPKLKYLSVTDCPEIETFPEGGLPPNLTNLAIYNCEKLLSCLSSTGGLQGLTNLGISCQSVKSFPTLGLLPQLPSLTGLYLDAFESMETLDCEGLSHLTSLQVLSISQCSKLKSIVGERLPPSLLKLEIYVTPLLGKLCQEKHVEIWTKVSHIRGIQVDSRWIS